MTTPDSPLLERLRNKNWLWTVPGALREEAANEIERLQKQLQEFPMTQAYGGFYHMVGYETHKGNYETCTICHPKKELNNK